jgi:circadian clock protein KaiB
MAENASRNGSRVQYTLHLYISGASPRSKRALTNVKEICEEHLKGRYDLEVVDILQTPEDLGRDRIIAAPTLIKTQPLPARRFIGDQLADKEKLFSALKIMAA